MCTFLVAVGEKAEAGLMLQNGSNNDSMAEFPVFIVAAIELN